MVNVKKRRIIGLIAAGILLICAAVKLGREIFKYFELLEKMEEYDIEIDFFDYFSTGYLLQWVGVIALGVAVAVSAFGKGKLVWLSIIPLAVILAGNVLYGIRGDESASIDSMGYLRLISMTAEHFGEMMESLSAGGTASKLAFMALFGMIGVGILEALAWLLMLVYSVFASVKKRFMKKAWLVPGLLYALAVWGNFAMVCAYAMYAKMETGVFPSEVMTLVKSYLIGTALHTGIAVGLCMVCCYLSKFMPAKMPKIKNINASSGTEPAFNGQNGGSTI